TMIGTNELAAELALPEVARLSADLTTKLSSLGIDQTVEKCEGGHVDIVWEATTAAGASGDDIVFTCLVEDSPDNSAWTTRKTYTHTVTVDANNAEHYGSIRIPYANLNGLAQYVRGSVTLAAGTGAPTISASAGSVNVVPTHLRDYPETGYDVLGYGVETITP
ncbi:MAG: hypothetical protein KAU31_06915, partial [Spirochaetaceae bacterium]|nr:hypothetical protein [Spirochaetaceae bacterium]